MIECYRSNHMLAVSTSVTVVSLRKWMGWRYDAVEGILDCLEECCL